MEITQKHYDMIMAKGYDLAAYDPPSSHWSKRRYDPALWEPYLTDAPRMTRQDALEAERLNNLSRWRYYYKPEIEQRFILDGNTGELFYNLDDMINVHAVRSSKAMMAQVERGVVPSLGITLAGAPNRPVGRYNITLGPWGIRGRVSKESKHRSKTISPMFTHALLLGLVDLDDDTLWQISMKQKPQDRDGFRNPYFYRRANLTIAKYAAKRSAASMAVFLSEGVLPEPGSKKWEKPFGQRKRTDEALQESREEASDFATLLDRKMREEQGDWTPFSEE